MDKCGLKSVVAVMGSLAMLGLGACSTTQTVKVASAAPITYKVGQGDSSYASIEAPTERRIETPAYRQEAPRVQTQPPAPQREASLPQYDLSQIDRQLYKHQKVGKPYKVLGQKYTPRHDPDYDERGVASWYGDKFHGKPTANGEVYDKSAMTAAHKTLPLNSYVIVTNLENGRVLKLRLNDRGPFVGGRIIDLSEAAAAALGVKAKGLGQVRVQYAGPADPTSQGRMYQAEPPAPRVEAPQQVAEDLTRERSEPKPAQREAYRPLREQSQPLAGLPQDNPYARVPDIMGPVPELVMETPQVSPQVALPDLPAIPKAQPQNQDDGVVTLTIKGPIHMARSDTKKSDARWIPAVHKTETRTQK